MQAIDAGELKVPQLNGFAHDVRGEDDKVVGLVAANQLRQERGTTQAQRRGVNTRLVKLEPVENGWEKHAFMGALKKKRAAISRMEADKLKRSGGGIMESVMATAWAAVL
eukprot:jgi/Tetstr1/446171/TSEL_003572.t1